MDGGSDTEILIREDSDEEVPAHLPAVRAVPLPDGTKYHLFISHSNESEEEPEWVEQLVDTLENQYDYKCLWPFRDFTPGQDIGKQIQLGMAQSLRVMCVLTPESLESGWCEYERNLAFLLSINDKANRVIPLLLKECEVPCLFKTINYIDVPKGENYLNRINQCFSETNDLRDIIPNMNHIVQKLDNVVNDRRGYVGNLPVNGRQIRIQAKHQSTLCRSAWFFEQQEKESFTSLYNPQAEYVYEEARRIINDAYHLRTYPLTHSPWRTPVLCISFCMAVLSFTLLLIVTFTTTVLQGNGAYALIVFILMCILSGPCIIAFIACTNVHNKRVADKKVTKFCLETLLDTKLLVRYENKPCGAPATQLCRELLRRSTDIEENNERMKAQAWWKIRCFLEEKYDRILKWTSLDTTAVNGHPTLGDKKCVCEMIIEMIGKP